MAPIRACALAELVDGAPLAVEVDDVEVVLVRQDGQVHALRDECSHASVQLSEGDVEDGTIECWLHGSAFALATGEALSLPATDPVPVYPVTVDGEHVLVDVSTPQPAP